MVVDVGKFRRMKFMYSMVQVQVAMGLGGTGQPSKSQKFARSGAPNPAQLVQTLWDIDKAAVCAIKGPSAVLTRSAPITHHGIQHRQGQWQASHKR